MKDDRLYPDESAGPFPTPPVSVEDSEGRSIEVRPYDGSDAEFEALAAMYDAFDSTDRAQGIPPAQERRIRDWLETILGGDCLNVIAWFDEAAVGHATLVPDEDAYELAIFVLQGYQEAGIGTHLLQTLLGHGADEGVERVWLTVERWNRAAVGLYEKLGFETADTESFEIEMALRLAPASAAE